MTAAATDLGSKSYDLKLMFLFFCPENLFAYYLSRAQRLSKSVSNVIDLYHNKEVEGGGALVPPPDYFG